MDQYTAFIALANTATLVAGGLIVLFAYRAFARTGSSALRAVVIGFGLIVVGTIVGGAVHLFGGNVALGVAIQSGVTAGGFLALLYSLYAETAQTTVVTASSEESARLRSQYDVDQFASESRSDEYEHRKSDRRRQ